MDPVEPFVVDYEQKSAERVFDYGEAALYPDDLYRFNGIASGVDGFGAVSTVDIERFDHQGYLVVDNAFTAGEVQAVIEGLLYLLSGQHPSFRGVMYEKKSQGVAVPLKPGGALFFHSLIHQGTPANNSPKRRRAVQFHFAPASVQRTAKEERLAIFGEEGKDVTC